MDLGHQTNGLFANRVNVHVHVVTVPTVTFVACSSMDGIGCRSAFANVDSFMDKLFAPEGLSFHYRYFYSNPMQSTEALQS